MDKETFNRLLTAMRSDKHAVIPIYEFYYNRIVSFVLSRYGQFGMSFGEDVAMDFFSYLVSSHDKIGPVDTPTGWIYRICLNIAHKKSLGIGRSVEYDEDLHAVAVDFDAEKEQENESLRAFLMRHLDKLEYRIVYDHIWWGYSLLEIARDFDINYATVRKKYNRALKKLKNYCNILSQFR